SETAAVTSTLFSPIRPNPRLLSRAERITASGPRWTFTISSASFIVFASNFLTCICHLHDTYRRNMSVGREFIMGKNNELGYKSGCQLVDVSPCRWTGEKNWLAGNLRVAFNCSCDST